MTLDAEVKERLAALAAEVPVGDPPVTRMARRGRRRARLRKGAIAASVVGVLGVAGVIGGYVLRAPEEYGAALRSGDGDAFTPALRGPSGLLPEEGAPSTGRTIEESGGQLPAGAPQTEPDAPPIAGFGPKVIKTAGLTLEVGQGRFQGAFSDAQQVAERHGGFVTASSTTGREARSGELTIRVPVHRFEAALVELKDLGDVRRELVRGEDVTADFVDLQARLRHWEAQERVLLRLLNQANSIGESLQVQRELQDVQLEIERIRGQLRVLRDRTAFATITMAMHEEGAAPADEPEIGELGNAWDRALSGALDVIGAVVIGLGYLLPIALLLTLVWLGIRAMRARSAA